MRLRSWPVIGAFLFVSWTGPAAATGAESLASGADLPCSSRETATGKEWPCVFRITSRDAATGAIEGEIRWTTLGAVHRIEGRLSGDRLTFTETEAIQAGSAHLKVAYTMTVSGTAATGTYADPVDGGKGTATITLPEADATEGLELSSRSAGVDLLVSRRSFACESRDSKTRKKDPCKLRVTSYVTSTGALVGELTWTAYGAVHRIEGRITGNSLSFKETKAIRKGPLSLNATYSMKVQPGIASGSWSEPAGRNQGTMTIFLK